MCSLDNPRAKLKRAQEHLIALDAATGEFFKVDPYQIAGEFDADASEYLFRVKVRQEPPLRLGVILGDFVHNLRSALDLLVWQLALLDGGRPSRDTNLPTADSRPQFEHMAATALNGLTPEHVARIEALQPYHAGNSTENHLLVLLPRLSNIDKHQVIHPTLGWFRSDLVSHVRFIPNEDAGVVQKRWLAGRERMDDGAVIARVKLAPNGPNPHVEMETEAEIDIAFGERAIRAESLGKAAELVNEIIESFAPDFEVTGRGVS